MREVVAAVSLAALFVALPKGIAPSTEEPRVLFAQAYTLFSQDNLSQAEELLRKTLERNFPLEDYSLYWLGQISSARRDMETSRYYLSRLKQAFPRSVWSSHVDLHLAKIALTEKNYPQAAQQLLALRMQTAKAEVTPEALYLLGQTHEAQGQWKEAHSMYEELRRTAPLSPWAAKARKETKKLREQQPQLFGPTTVETLAVEGELLLREREYQEAERAYRQILEVIPRGNQRPRYLAALANVYRAARKRETAIPLLEETVRKYPQSPEAPNALYRLAETYWNRDDSLKALDYFKQLHMLYPNSPFAHSAYFSSARIYESLARPDEARSIYQDFPKRFPGSRLRAEAIWRLAWVHYLQADYSRAYAVFKELAGDKGAERYKSGALYWQARSAEKMGRNEEAKQIFTHIANELEESYYSGAAARWLERMGPVVDKEKALSSSLLPEPAAPGSPELSFHLSRARALAEISLNHLAVAELDAVKSLSSGDLPVKILLMREYARNKAFTSSVALANQIHLPSDELNRYRYPLAHWEAIQKIARERGLDPYLVVALIRQESLFDPQALSPASAFGLMQLLPSTAVRIARQGGLSPPQPERLFDPDLNLTLGTDYLKQLLQLYSNNLVKAIAAYNAGEGAVARWEKQIPAEDEEEFIERIPYAETRLYVKLVLRNYRIYRRLYDSRK